LAHAKDPGTVADYLERALERWRADVQEHGDLRAGASLAGRVEHAIEAIREGGEL